MAKYITAIAQTAERFHNEKNDCTVRAAANALGAPYQRVHAIMKRYGRADRHGAYMHTIMGAYKELGLRLLCITGTTEFAEMARKEAKNQCISFLDRDGITLERMLPTLRQGRYVCLMRSHAFAVVDGKVMDYGSLRAGTRVTALFRVV